MRIQTFIRETYARDLPALHAVIERAYRGSSARAGWTHEADFFEHPRASLQVLELAIVDPDQRLLSAWRGDVVVGCVAIADGGNGLSYLGQLCVEPHLQARGIGKQLLAAAEGAAATAFGASRITMEVIEYRTTLIAYYARRGYHANGVRRDVPLAKDKSVVMAVLEKLLDVKTGLSPAPEGPTGLIQERPALPFTLSGL